MPQLGIEPKPFSVSDDAPTNRATRLYHTALESLFLGHNMFAPKLTEFDKKAMRHQICQDSTSVKKKKKNVKYALTLIRAVWYINWLTRFPLTVLYVSLGEATASCQELPDGPKSRHSYCPSEMRCTWPWGWGDILGVGAFDFLFQSLPKSQGEGSIGGP